MTRWAELLDWIAKADAELEEWPRQREVALECMRGNSWCVIAMRHNKMVVPPR